MSGTLNGIPEDETQVVPGAVPIAAPGPEQPDGEVAPAVVNGPEPPENGAAITQENGQELANLFEALDLEPLVEAAANDPVAQDFAARVQQAVQAILAQPDVVAGDLPEDSVLAWLKPLNNSGGQAVASLGGDGITLTGTIVGSGFAANQTLSINLSGFVGEQPSQNPDIMLDTNEDGVLSLAEVQQATGPVILELGTVTTDADGGFTFSVEQPFADGATRILREGLDARHLGITQVAGAGQPGDEDQNGAENGVAPAQLAGPLPVAGGLTASFDEDLGTVIAALATVQPELIADAFAAVLGVQAPYKLDAEGAPRAPEDPRLAQAEVSDFVALIAPVNNSGVFGMARITFDEEAGTLDLRLVLEGLTPGEAHPMHIHGFGDDRPSLTPDLRADLDGDGFLEGFEAMPLIGPVLMAFTADGSISDAMLTADFPVADEQGRITLEQSYQFDLDDRGQAAILDRLEERLAGRHIEVHGLELYEGHGAGTPGEASGEEGFQIALPVAGGAVLPVLGLGGGLAAGVAYVLEQRLAGEEADVAGMLERVVAGLEAVPEAAPAPDPAPGEEPAPAVGALPNDTLIA